VIIGDADPHRCHVVIYPQVRIGDYFHAYANVVVRERAVMVIASFCRAAASSVAMDLVMCSGPRLGAQDRQAERSSSKTT